MSIVIEDYFTLEKKVHYLEQENKKLINRIDKLEETICNIDKIKEKTRLQNIYHNSKKMYSVYQQSKIILMTVCFLFGNKILTNPWILKSIVSFVLKK